MTRTFTLCSTARFSWTITCSYLTKKKRKKKQPNKPWPTNKNGNTRKEMQIFYFKLPFQAFGSDGNQDILLSFAGKHLIVIRVCVCVCVCACCRSNTFYRIYFFFRTRGTIMRLFGFGEGGYSPYAALGWLWVSFFRPKTSVTYKLVWQKWGINTDCSVCVCVWLCPSQLVKHSNLSLIHISEPTRPP